MFKWIARIWAAKKYVGLVRKAIGTIKEFPNLYKETDDIVKQVEEMFKDKYASNDEIDKFCESLKPFLKRVRKTIQGK